MPSLLRLRPRANWPAALAMGCCLSCLPGCMPAAPPAPAPAHQLHGASIERGRMLLAQYQCGACHTIPDVAAARGTVAPPLAQFGSRSYIAGRLANQPDTLARWIADPQALVPGTAMPSMGATPADARDMAAWLLSQR